MCAYLLLFRFILKGVIFGLFSESSGGNSVNPPEAVFEVIAAVKTAVQSNLRNGIVGSKQHLAGLSDTDIVDIFFEGGAGNFFKLSGEIGGSQVYLFCNLIKSDGKGKVFGDIAEGSLDITADAIVMFYFFIDKDTVSLNIQ